MFGRPQLDAVGRNAVNAQARWDGATYACDQAYCFKPSMLYLWSTKRCVHVCVAEVH